MQALGAREAENDGQHADVDQLLPFVGKLDLGRHERLYTHEGQRHVLVGAADEHLPGELARIGQPVDQYLVDVGAHLQILVGRAHHDERIHALRIAVVGAGRGHIAADGGLDGAHDPVRRRLDGVFRKQRRGGGIGLRQRDIVLFLVLDVVYPRAGLGQRVLLADDLEIGGGDLLRVPGIVQRIAAHGFRVERVGALLLLELIIGILESRARVVDLCGGHIEVLPAGFRLELRQQGARSIGLRLQLLHGRTLHGVVDFEQRIAFLHRGALGHQDLGDGPRHLRIDIDVLAVRLTALDDALRVDSLCIGIGGGIERRRERRGLLTGDDGADQGEHEPDARHQEDDLTAHPMFLSRFPPFCRPPFSRCDRRIRRCGCRASR